jgi:glycosyltransferase involved in cell wall biosynthesis
LSAYQFGFILEQTLGHATHASNLKANVLRDPEVSTYWQPISWETTGLARHIPIYRTNWTVRAGLRARRAIAELASIVRLDALFFHTQVPAMLAVNWMRRIPSVISLDATPIQYDQLGAFYGHARRSALVERMKWQLHHDCLHAASRIVTWSHWAKRGLVNDYQVPEQRITVIPPGVNAGEWARPGPRPRHAGPTKILFVGGDIRRKGGLLLLEAFRTLRPLDVELHVVTHDVLASEPGLFVYTDMQPNSDALKRLYHESDIFCLPTYGDCLPMVLSEAGAAGLPSVATRIAAIPEIVQDGETGFLIPPGDVAALTVALRRLVTNPDLRLEQGARATALVAREFDASCNARRLLSLLKLVADTTYIAGEVV